MAFTNLLSGLRKLRSLWHVFACLANAISRHLYATYRHLLLSNAKQALVKDFG